METNEKSAGNGKKPNYFIYLSILLFIVCCILTWKLVSYKQIIVEKETIVTNVTGEKDQALAKLKDLQEQYDKLSKENTELSDMFAKEKEHVEKLMQKIKNSNGSIEKYKKQITSMEGRLKEYEQQIEQLKAQNKELVAENFVIKTALDSTVTENKNLSTENQDLSSKVDKGSALISYDLSASGIIAKSNGKEVPTKKTKRADKIKICFTVGENAIATAGKKDIYLRIAGPDGKILCKGTTDDYSFMYDGKLIQYSVKDQFDYKNKPVDLCLYWIKSGDFAAGTYYVDIFVDSKNIGSTTFLFEK
jgi:regulator of replication initiation timing